MSKLIVLGCERKKDCEADEELTEPPYTCCSHCTVKGGCTNEKEECPEVPDTCGYILSKKADTTDSSPCKCKIFVNDKDEVVFASVCKKHRRMTMIWKVNRLKFI